MVSDDQGKQDRVTLFRSDVLVVRASADSGPIGTPSVAAIRSAGPQSFGPEPTAVLTGPGWVEWRYELKEVGGYAFTFRAGGSEHTDTVNVVMNRQAFMERCSLAHAELNRRYTALIQTVYAASTAYSTAYYKQESALKEATRKEEILPDILIGLFFGAAGGAVGGAAGEIIKKWLGGDFTRANPMRAGAITDAGKDVAKYLTRSLPKLAGFRGSAPDTSGDAQAKAAGDPAATQSSGRTDAAGRRPSDVFDEVSGALAHESERLLGMLVAAMSEGSMAYDTGSPSEFEEDPYEAVARDRDMDEVVAGLKTDYRWYLSWLWNQWLERFGFEVAVDIPMADTMPGPDLWTVNMKMSLKMYNRIKEAQEECDPKGPDWITTYFDRARAEARRRNAGGGKP
jgi:hypothetical protein